MTLSVGFATPTTLWQSSLDQKHALLNELDDAGIDHVFMADHVSFHNGSGTDGFIEIAALSQLHSSLGVMISIYLLPLRHPMPVARQLATINTIAGGRVRFGVGVGGEDRHEIEVCGVDPATRGRLMDESLTILRQLMTGEQVDFSGSFFQLDAAQIRPAVSPPIPIIVGGRSNAALRRTARFGDGWIGAWCSPRRFTEAVGLIDEWAAEAGRTDVDWEHGYQPWVGVGDTRDEARVLVKDAMEAFYKIPFEAFEKYVPFGTPADVVDALAPYVQAGCRIMNMKVVAGTDAESIAAAGEIVTGLKG